ncbi:MAG: polysaccharide biosynthesis/export family protein [Planctomycetota bacterium]
MRGPLPWDPFGFGEYIGPHRTPHVPEYRLRVNDQLTFAYRLTRERSATPYELQVGDRIRLESLADKNLDRDLEVQPDGMITARLLGEVVAAGRTTEELRRDLEERYKKLYKVPAITVTPLKVNTKLEDLRSVVDARFGLGGQQFQVTVSPDGTVQLPGLGSVCVMGLTLCEAKLEVDARYRQLVQGIAVTPVLTQRAERFVYVLGEVVEGGRFELVAPTTVMQAIALAQGWEIGANLRQIVVFRRAEDWRLIATKIDLRGALYGMRPSPADEIWLRDSDIVLIPKSPLRVVTDALDLVLGDGIGNIAPVISSIIDAENLQNL